MGGNSSSASSTASSSASSSTASSASSSVASSASSSSGTPLGDACGGDGDCVAGAVCGKSLFGGLVCCNAHCNNGCEGCNANGTCKPVAAGQDPFNDCLPIAGQCKTGSCDGNGNCAVARQGTICSFGCDFASGKEPWSICNSAGTCVAEMMFACNYPGPMNCAQADNGCKCSVNSGCPDPLLFACMGGLCRPRLELGAACMVGSDCMSGSCDPMTQQCILGMIPSTQFCFFDESCASGTCLNPNFAIQPPFPGKCN